MVLFIRRVPRLRTLWIRPRQYWTQDLQRSGYGRRDHDLPEDPKRPWSFLGRGEMAMAVQLW